MTWSGLHTAASVSGIDFSQFLVPAKQNFLFLFFCFFFWGGRLFYLSNTVNTCLAQAPPLDPNLPNWAKATLPIFNHHFPWEFVFSELQRMISKSDKLQVIILHVSKQTHYYWTVTILSNGPENRLLRNSYVIGCWNEQQSANFFQT